MKRDGEDRVVAVSRMTTDFKPSPGVSPDKEPTPENGPPAMLVASGVHGAMRLEEASMVMVTSARLGSRLKRSERL